MGTDGAKLSLELVVSIFSGLIAKPLLTFELKTTEIKTNKLMFYFLPLCNTAVW